MAAPPRGLVVFVSDFGSSDPYAGIVRGVVEALTGGRVRVVDLTHDVPSFSVKAGAYVVYTSYRYFPRGTVFLVVVDPGVGTERRPIAAATQNYYFVGPDNGVLYPALEEDGVEEVRVLDNDAFHLKPVSHGFHGRDIFGPAAAMLAAGVPLRSLGSSLDPGELVRLSLRGEGCGEAEVVYVDHFGNVALGLRRECVEELCSGGRVRVEAPAGGFEASCRPVFSHGGRGELVFYVNSLGFPELGVNLGSAAERLGVRVGDRVALSSGG